jgi:hypothetical protein
MQAIGKSAHREPMQTASAESQKMIQQLLNPNQREEALAELSRCRESVADLAVLLWQTPSTVIFPI